ncbi:MAG: AraC family transcriptional regulator [Kiritimatiellae bacterium]|nr:AraC family transcriptional regulator [Kiritimatiellia bacterium]
MPEASSIADWPPLPLDKLWPSVLLASFHVCSPPYTPSVRIPGLNTYLILEGKMRFTMSDGAQGVAGPNTLVTFYAGINHYEVVSRQPLAIYQVVYTPAPPPCDRMVPALDGAGLLPHIVPAGDETSRLVTLFERIMSNLLRLPTAWRLDNAAAIQELIGATFRLVAHRAPEAPEPLDKWQRLLIRLEEEQTQMPPIGNLAAEMGLSVAHFIRAFRRLTGRTPRQYLLQRHLWNAHRLMHAGATVKMAALQTGFRDPSYFSRLYKKHFGRAPTHQPLDAAGQQPPPLLLGTSPRCRHLLAPGVDWGIFSPY